MVSILAILSFLLAVTTLGYAQSTTLEPTTTTTPPPEDKQSCIRELVEWCQKANYSSVEDGSILFARSSFDLEHNERIFCRTDFKGSECIRNRTPWFQCTANNTLTYKGEPLTADSEGDEDVCWAKKQAVQTTSALSFDRKKFEAKFKADMERFVEGMRQFREEMNKLRNVIFGRNFPSITYDDYNYNGKDGDDKYDNDKDDDDKDDDDKADNENDEYYDFP